MVRKSTRSGRTVCFSASPTGGCETIATYSMSRIMMAPSTTTMRSSATPARLDRKTRTAIAAEIPPPIFGSSPSMAFTPRPVPAMLPMLKTSPPMNTSAAMNQPRPGSTMLPSSLARSPEMPRTRHTFSWIAMSTMMDNRMAKPSAAPIWTVKTEVWVRNPGPMDEVAMRKTAPTIAPIPLPEPCAASLVCCS